MSNPTYNLYNIEHIQTEKYTNINFLFCQHMYNINQSGAQICASPNLVGLTQRRKAIL